VIFNYITKAERK